MAEFLVIGLNALGRTLARELARRGADVTVADLNPQRVSRIKDEVRAAVTLNSTDRDALEALEVTRFDHVIVCMARQFEAAERTTLALHDLGARDVTNVATTRERRDIFEAIGAERVVTPGLLQARNLAVELSAKLIDAFFYVGPDHGLAEHRVKETRVIPAERREAWFGSRVCFVGVARAREPGASRRAIDPAPAGDVTLAEGDAVLLFGKPDDISSVVKKRLT